MITVFGSPSYYGGAGSELWHTLQLWRAANLAVTVVPTWGEIDDLWKQRLKEIGCTVVISSPSKWKEIPLSKYVVSFCNDNFLKIARGIDAKIIWVNCMCYSFREERAFLTAGKRFHRVIYQSNWQRSQLEPILAKLGQDPSMGRLVRGAYVRNLPTATGQCIGRCARSDNDKWSSNYWHVWNMIPYAKKRGLFMGIERQVLAKLGQPPKNVLAYTPNHFTPADFYKQLYVMLSINGGAQENWPRIGLEALDAGVPIVTQNSWGWKEMLVNGETGYLCDTDEELAYRCAELFYRPHSHQHMRENGWAHLQSLISESQTQWLEIFE